MQCKLAETVLRLAPNHPSVNSTFVPERSYLVAATLNVNENEVLVVFINVYVGLPNDRVAVSWFATGTFTYELA